jgi:uncharacterized protein (TIGR03437 family)
MLNRLVAAFWMMSLGAGVAAWGQTEASWDTSGNSKLNGTYYFRHVIWVVSADADDGDLSDGIALYGTITFNGAGSYSINATEFDASENGTAPFTLTSTYSISASGYGFMTNPLSTGDQIYGLLANNGVFIGSSTENDFGYNDLFIAAPLASPAPGVNALSGTYTIAGIDNPDGEAIDARDYMLTFTANGSGSISVNNSSVLGFVTENGGASTNQSFGNVPYTASNGAFNLNFGNTGNLSDSNLLVGTHYLYMSSDGNFIFGGEPNGFDMFVGVKNPTSSPNFSGLYYAAGLDLYVLPILEGEGEESIPDSYYSSLVPVAADQSYILHQRLNYYFNGPFDYTAADPLTISGGQETDAYTGESYVFGQGGAIRIGVGSLAIEPTLGISVAFAAPTFSGSGPYINPTGIQNAASSALFTAGISPGELITIAGTGFPNEPGLKGLTLPTNMGGSQVLVNGQAAPIYFMTPTLIAIQVPYEITNLANAILSFQVVTPSGSSNTVTLFAGDTQPGIYTTTPGGIGTAAAFHTATFQAVTPGNPAVPGETIGVYVDGLGTVNPAGVDGAPASSTVLSNTNFTITADLNDPAVGQVDATVAFAGLAPTYPALYQVNVTVPSGTTSSEVYLELYGLDSTGNFVESYNSQALIPMSASASASAQPAAKYRAARGLRIPPKRNSRRPSARQPRKNPS